jgi:hypothetical protein
MSSSTKIQKIRQSRKKVLTALITKNTVNNLTYARLNAMTLLYLFFLAKNAAIVRRVIAR